MARGTIKIKPKNLFFVRQVKPCQGLNRLPNQVQVFLCNHYMDDKTKYELRYIVIPHHAYKDNRLNFTSIRVYGFINSYTNPFKFGNEHLAEMFNCHVQTISTAIGQLEELGYIKTKYKIKSDGGKTRLCVNAHSDSASTLSRLVKDRAPTERKHSGKGDKDNILKGKILKTPKKQGKIPNNLDNDTLYNIKKAKKAKKEERKAYPPYRDNNYQKYPQKKRGGVDCTDIL